MKTLPSLLALVLAGALPLGALAADATKPSPTTGTGSATGQPMPSPTTPAEMGKPEVPPMFKELDKDKDGQITRDEAKRSAEITSTFDTLDTDHNGKVSLLEWNMTETQKPGAKP